MRRMKLSLLLSALLAASPALASCKPAALSSDTGTSAEQARGARPPETAATLVESRPAAPMGAEAGGADAIVAGKVIWAGESGGFLIRWTTADLSAAPVAQPGAVVFSARRTARTEVLAGLGAQPTEQDWPYSDYQRTFKLLSVVGPLVSLEDELVYANPGTYMTRNYRVVDLTHPTQELSLADLFPADELLKTLLADSVVRAALETGGVTEQPRTLATLVQMLDEGQPKHSTGNNYFERGMLTHFAFYSVKRGKVAVRLGIPYQAGMRDEALTQIGLWLNIPPALQSSLAHAAMGGAGFLMRESGRIAARRKTVISLDQSVLTRRAGR